MKRNLLIAVLFSLIAGLCVSPVFAQATGTVKGVCKDFEGKLIVGGSVEYLSSETGRKYTVKTNGKGEFLSLGIAPGKYKVTLYSKDNQVLFYFNSVNVTLDEETNILNFDLQKEKANAQPQMTEEQKKELEKRQKENATIKTLNAKLAEAKAATDAGNFDQAVAVLAEAAQVDPNRDLIWFKLGDAYRSSAGKETDSAAKTKKFEQAVESYNKAIAIKPTGAYYNNMGEAAAKSGKVDEAVKAYNQAAQLEPASAGQYYFNLGAVLTNTGKVDEAIDAFKKAIVADPNRADAYYWTGVNLLGKATLKGDKMVAPEGTAEAFNKYLELQPTGQFAQPAKDMLASIGASVETSFGTKKKAKSK